MTTGNGLKKGMMRIYIEALWKNYFNLVNWFTGKTSILHDSEAPMDVGHCADPGCYSREINYTATMRQMTTLVELSSECHQSIKVKGTFNYTKLL
jgi:hypothetical protein